MDGERLAAERFQIVSRLGEGAFGVVYEARDRAKGERVAVKALHRVGPEALLRFKQEFRSLRDIRHPNLVRLDELIEQRGRWYITMELVRGADVLSYVRRGSWRRRTDQLASGPRTRPSFDEERLRSVLAQLAQGLSALHEAGKVHRDIKPSNVRVAHDGRVVLLDFGLVADSQEDSSTAPSMVGTAAYMSPEQASSGPVTAASDWYSVGVILYEALTGQRPFTGSPLQVMLDKQRRAPAPPSLLAPDVPDDLDTLCMELLSPEPARRPSDALLLGRLGARSLVGPAAQRVPFVGRAQELAELVGAVEGLVQGASALFYVAGASGSGKTRLLAELIQRVRSDMPATLVLRGRCHESETVPYKAFDGIIDGVSRYLRHVGDERARALVPDGSSALGEVFPVLARIDAVTRGREESAGMPDPWAQRNLVFNAIRELFARLGRSVPVLLVIDDLHWADAESVQLLERLVSEPDRPRIVIVAAGRPPERCPPSVRHVLAFATASQPSRVLSLGELSQAEAEVFARELLAQRAAQLATVPESDVIERVTREVVREAHGHPFLIEFMVRNGRVLGEGLDSVPSLDVVLARAFEALADEDRLALELLSLAAAPLRLRVLGQALGMTPAQFADCAARLSSRGFVVEDGAGEEISLSVVQERIQTAVLAGLGPSERAERHGHIARALLSAGSQDAEALALHLGESGDLETATHYAVIAAGAAYDALAFDRAARLYELALSLSKDEKDLRRKRRLLARLGDALAGAGKSGAAAEAYLAAVEVAADMDSGDLLTRAAQQMIQSGRMREGIDVIRRLLRSRGHAYPDSTPGALASLLWARARLKLRGLRFEERGATWVAPERLSEVDLLWSVSCTLGMVDLTRAADVQTRHLLAALDAGEPYRVARALAMEGWFQQSTLPAPSLRIQEIFSRARLLAARSAHPHAQAVVALAEGAAAGSVCRFEESLRKCEEAERILRERCRAASWEVDSAQYVAGLALLYLGRFGEICRRAPVLLREARERGDKYAETLLRLSIGYWPDLLRGDTDSAVNDVRAAAESWRSVGFTTQAFIKFVALANIYLFAAPERAYDVLEQELATLDRSTIARVPALRVLVKFQLAQAALASACVEAPDSDRARQRYELASKHARDLGRELLPMAQPYGNLVAGAVAAQLGDPARALSCLHEAAARFDSLDMALYAAAARYREGLLLGGERGKTQCERSISWVLAQGISPPEKLLATAAPGYRG